MNIIPAQGFGPAANLDDGVIRMWLHARQPNTAAAYERDARLFLARSGKAIAQVSLADLQEWATSMTDVAHATRARRLAALKSLLSFAHRVGYLALNPGAALRVEKAQTTSVERILSQGDVKRMIAGEIDPRRRALLLLLYVCGLRASEVCGLRWRDMTGSEAKGGEARVLGKGAKLRRVIVPPSLWRELAALSSSITPDMPVMPARDGGALDRGAVHRAVKRAARRAGVSDQVSAHWLRHSHGTHALENGCSLAALMKSMGHASVATTSTYLHARPGDGSASFIKV